MRRVVIDGLLWEYEIAGGWYRILRVRPARNEDVTSASSAG